MFGQLKVTTILKLSKPRAGANSVLSSLRSPEGTPFSIPVHLREGYTLRQHAVLQAHLQGSGSICCSGAL